MHAGRATLTSDVQRCRRSLVLARRTLGTTRRRTHVLITGRTKFTRRRRGRALVLKFTIGAIIARRGRTVKRSPRWARATRSGRGRPRRLKLTSWTIFARAIDGQRRGG